MSVSRWTKKSGPPGASDPTLPLADREGAVAVRMVPAADTACSFREELVVGKRREPPKREC
jgi:hypothetical protein